MNKENKKKIYPLRKHINSDGEEMIVFKNVVSINMKKKKIVKLAVYLNDNFHPKKKK